MTRSNIQTALEKLFNKHRLVFWYDEKKELRSEFDSLDLDGVEKVTVTNNEYGLKYRMLKEQPKQRFLIYREGKRPDDLENWLLDLELAHDELRIDQESIWLSDLGLGIEKRNVQLIQQCREFFTNKRRVEALAKALDRDDTEGTIKRKMLQICVGAKQPRVDSVLEEMLGELAEGRSEGEKLVDRCGLSDFLWEQVKGYYHYQSDIPGVEDFAILLFKSCFDMDMGKESRLKDSAIGFINRWKNNRLHKAAFEILSEKYAKFLSIQNIVESQDFRKLVDIDYFELIDQKILSSLVREVDEKTISKDECSQIVRQRRPSHWYEEYAHAYEAIDHACQLIYALEAIDLIPTDFDDGIKKYTENWHRIDQLYRKFILSYRAFKRGDLLKNLYDKVEKLYSNTFLLTLSDNWQKIIDRQDKWSGFNCTLQRQFFSKYVEPFLEKDKKVYVIISDALRYEIGKELSSRIMQADRYDSIVDCAVSQIPSYTQLGMAALLPNKILSFSDDDTGKILVDGMPATGTAGRDRIIKTYKKTGSTIQHKDFMELGRDESRDLLKENEFLYIYHNQIDFVGDKRDSEERVFEAAETTIEELIGIIKKLTAANATNIIVTADHGFLFQYKPLQESDFLSAEAEGHDIRYHDRRFILGKGLTASGSFRSYKAVDLGIESDFEIQIPKSINRLRKQGSGSRFVHGGTTLQEIVIPIVKINKKRQSDITRVDIEVLQGATSTITSGQHSVAFYQQEPASEKTQPRILRAGIYSEDGELISDSFELAFDSQSENPRDRETKRRFILTRRADEFNNQEVYLKLEEKIPGTSHYQEYRAIKFLIKRSFSSDFEF